MDSNPPKLEIGVWGRSEWSCKLSRELIANRSGSPLPLCGNAASSSPPIPILPLEDQGDAEAPIQWPSRAGLHGQPQRGQLLHDGHARRSRGKADATSASDCGNSRPTRSVPGGKGGWCSRRLWRSLMELLSRQERDLSAARRGPLVDWQPGRRRPWRTLKSEPRRRAVVRNFPVGRSGWKPEYKFEVTLN